MRIIIPPDEISYDLKDNYIKGGDWNAPYYDYRSHMLAFRNISHFAGIYTVPYNEGEHYYIEYILYINIVLNLPYIVLKKI